MIKIDILDETLEEEYENFLMCFEYSQIFYSVKYKKLLELINPRIHSNYYIFIEGSHIKGILPIMELSGKWGKVINSLPFFGSHGGIIANDEEIESFIARFYNEIILKEANLLSSVIISNPLIEVNYRNLKILYNFTDKRIGQFTTLNFSDEQDLLKKLSSKKRWDIRKALKLNVKVTIDNSMIDFIERVHRVNISSKGGTTKPHSFFKNLPICFEEGKDYNIYIAYVNSEPIAGVLILYYNNIVEYFIPVIIDKYKTYQALSLAIYKAMLDARKNGFKLWNWGGTWLSQQGVYRFKKAWQDFEKEYNYYIYFNRTDITLTKEEILIEYPFFYIIPFHILEGD